MTELGTVSSWCLIRALRKGTCLQDCSCSKAQIRLQYCQDLLGTTILRFITQILKFRSVLPALE